MRRPDRCHCRLCTCNVNKQQHTVYSHLMRKWRNVLFWDSRRESGTGSLVALFLATASPYGPYCWWSSSDAGSTGWLWLLLDCVCGISCCITSVLPVQAEGMSHCYWPCCGWGNLFLWQARALRPGLRDRSTTLGREKRGKGQEGRCEPVPFGVRRLEIILCIQPFFPSILCLFSTFPQ